MREDPLFDKIAALYRDLDHELSRLAPFCAGCGECCRFDRADHIVYASRLERLYLLRASPPPPPEPGLAELVASGKRCPYQHGDACLAREGRVLGCRLFFCRWPDGGEEEFYERWHRRLKRLHDETGEAWEYAPLLPLPADGKKSG